MPSPQSNALSSTEQLLPDDLIVEILVFLDVQTLLPLKCLSKSLHSLISDPKFIKKHLKNSSQYTHLILTDELYDYSMSNVKTLPVRRLLENRSFNSSGDSCRGCTDSNDMEVIGSCNGLLCLLYKRWHWTFNLRYWFYIWNPATGTSSPTFGTRYDSLLHESLSNVSSFSFGCDILTGTYKVLEFRIEQDKDNHVPLRSQNYFNRCYDYETITHVDHFVIISLDLSTETTIQLLLPSKFDEVPCFQPTLQVLSDHICFSHDFKKTEFVIWKMNEFGVQESWTQLFRIGYFNLEMHNLPMDDYLNTTLLMPLSLSRNEDTLILLFPLTRTKVGDRWIYYYYGDNEAIIYDHKENRAQRISTDDNPCRFSYVESLVSTSRHWKSVSPSPSTLETIDVTWKYMVENRGIPARG
ncbi:putative F-box domain-containing protein [Medicago truncatula]|uniref:Putative F-box domain-containing protein n=1 Tax=Medicago truncatula TaxID=3880 RepID=A0A396GYW3_MEDTR|nr:putative F-box domain-containing protein [Medicago truncatula]